MDASTRSQLESNALAQWLADLPDKLRRNGTTILLVIVLVAALIFFLRTRASNALVREQTRQINAQNAAFALDNLAELDFRVPDPELRAIERKEMVTQANDGIDGLLEHGGETARLVGLLARGDLYWQLATATPVTAATTRPELAVSPPREESLTSAETAYNAVLEEAEGPGFAARHRLAARSGLAAVAEEKGEFDAAEIHYQAIVDDPDADDVTVAIAEQRLLLLDELRVAPPLLPATRPAGE